MKQVLFEEDGAFRVGTILSEAGASFQVEAAHGKRSKVKGSSVLAYDPHGDAAELYRDLAKEVLNGTEAREHA